MTEDDPHRAPPPRRPTYRERQLERLAEVRRLLHPDDEPAEEGP